MAHAHRVRPWLRAAGFRGLLLGLGWWALTGGDRDGLSFGAAVVAAATLGSIALTPPSPGAHRRHPLPLLGFFLVGSVRGGWDVARRALAPRLPLSPVLLPFRTRLPEGPPRRLFTSILSLMPGSLSAGFDGRDVLVHALADRGDALHDDLRRLERHVAAALGVALEGEEVADA